MELEQMKTIWKTESESHFSNQQIDKQTIGSVMKQQSHNTLAIIKRKMKFKVLKAGAFGLFAIILGFLFLFGVLDEPLSVAEFLTVNETGYILMLMGIVLGVVAVVNHLSYKRIHQFEKSSEPLKQTLNQTVDILLKVMSIGIYSDVIFVPLIAGFASYIWLFQRNGLALDSRLFYLALLTGGIAVLSYMIASRLMQKKHGDNLQRLKGYILELETFNEETA
jgi:hypothetical protein